MFTESYSTDMSSQGPLKGLLTDKSDAIGSCNLKPNDNDNENDDNLSSN